MPIKINKELETAILDLPSKEKNKLLLRLLAKNQLLLDQLQFKLLEGTESDIDFRVTQIKEEIQLSHDLLSTRYGRQSLLFFKSNSAKINYHKKVTADKLSELRLIVHLLVFTQSNYSHSIQNDASIFADKFRVLLVKKTIAAIKLLKSVHEDYFIEFESTFENLLSYFHEQSYTKYIAMSLDLPHSIE